MLTRMSVNHAYRPAVIHRYLRPGFARMEMHNNVPTVWAIARPVNSPPPDGGPLYMDFPNRSNQLAFGGWMPLRMTQPNLEMDPSNTATWQRTYRFSS